MDSIKGLLFILFLGVVAFLAGIVYGWFTEP